MILCKHVSLFSLVPYILKLTMTYNCDPRGCEILWPPQARVFTWTPQACIFTWNTPESMKLHIHILKINTHIHKYLSKFWDLIGSLQVIGSPVLE